MLFQSNLSTKGAKRKLRHLRLEDQSLLLESTIRALAMRLGLIG